jgi:hypothetical protein
MVADSYTSMKGMACNNYRWKAANQSKGWRIKSNLKSEYDAYYCTAIQNKYLIHNKSNVSELYLIT